MRYLKKFNESIDQAELKEFCEGSLISLIDDGFTIDISESYVDNFIFIFKDL